MAWIRCTRHTGFPLRRAPVLGANQVVQLSADARLAPGRVLWILPREDVTDVDAAAAADAEAPAAGAASAVDAPLEARMPPLTAEAVRPAVGGESMGAGAPCDSRSCPE